MTTGMLIIVDELSSLLFELRLAMEQQKNPLTRTLVSDLYLISNNFIREIPTSIPEQSAEMPLVLKDEIEKALVIIKGLTHREDTDLFTLSVVLSVEKCFRKFG